MYAEVGPPTKLPFPLENAKILVPFPLQRTPVKRLRSLRHWLTPSWKKWLEASPKLWTFRKLPFFFFWRKKKKKNRTLRSLSLKCVTKQNYLGHLKEVSVKALWEKKEQNGNFQNLTFGRLFRIVNSSNFPLLHSTLVKLSTFKEVHIPFHSFFFFFLFEASLCIFQSQWERVDFVWKRLNKWLETTAK